MTRYVLEVVCRHDQESNYARHEVVVPADSMRAAESNIRDFAAFCGIEFVETLGTIEDGGDYGRGGDPLTIADWVRARTDDMACGAVAA